MSNLTEDERNEVRRLAHQIAEAHGISIAERDAALAVALEGGQRGLQYLRHLAAGAKCAPDQGGPYEWADLYVSSLVGWLRFLAEVPIARDVATLN